MQKLRTSEKTSSKKEETNSIPHLYSQMLAFFLRILVAISHGVAATSSGLCSHLPRFPPTPKYQI